MAYQNTVLPDAAADFVKVPNEYQMGLRYGLPLAWIGRNPDRKYLMEELERTLEEFRQKGITQLETGGQGSGSDIVPDGELVSATWKEMFKTLVRKCNEKQIHVQLSGTMSAQPLGYLPENSDGSENFRPKRLWATDAAAYVPGMTKITLHGDSINCPNQLIAVTAVRYETDAEGNKVLKESRLLDGFTLETTEIPEAERAGRKQSEARLYIERRMDQILKKIDMSAVLRGCMGFVSDDGKPNTTPISIPLGPGDAPPEGDAPENAPSGPGAPEAPDTPNGPPAGGPPAGGPPAGGPGGDDGFSPPGYEKRSIQEPASYLVTVTGPEEPLNLPEGSWDLIAFYQLVNPKNTHTPNPGPFAFMGDDHKHTIVNCFTAEGADHIIDTFEKFYFDDEMRELLRANGCGLFYDGGDGDPRVDDTTWSENLPEAFERYTGYSILPYLPVIYSGYRMDGDGEQRLLLEKYKVLSILYKDFLLRMSEWMAGYNGGYHHQVAYSTTLETQEAMRGLSCPEVESLNYMSNPGAYNAASAAGRLEGNNIISCEMGATFRNPYRGKLRNLMTEINTALIAGVNQMKLHTSTFVYGEDAVWPGANIHYSSLPDFNATQPFWLEMDQFAPAICRGQYAVRRGKARRDVMVYLREFMKPEGNYDCCDDLVRAGYTYDYYDAEMMRDAGKTVNGVIQPEKAAFRAVIVDSTKLPDACRMPTLAAEAILGFLKGGAAVIAAGPLPSKTEGLADNEEQLRKLWKQIAAEAGFRQVGSMAEVPAALKAMGIVPMVEPEAPCGLTSWATDADGIRSYYLFNQHRTYYHPYPMAAAFDQKVTFQGHGTPYWVNLWSGEVTMAQQFERTGDRITIPVAMEAGQAALLVIGGEELPAPGIRAKQSLMPMTLDRGWRLQIERWTPENPYRTSAEGPAGTATRKTLLPEVTLDALKPWREIDGIAPGTSGVGYYENTIVWNGEAERAVLKLGSCWDTVRVWLNGEELPIDHLALTCEIGSLLKQGENTLRIRATSGLCNELYELGAFPAEFGYADFGLLGPVTVQPYNYL